MTLPEGVKAEDVAAGFDRGVLEVRIPKPAERKPHRVEISAGRTVEGEGSEKD
jgi:HSP20 family protein